MIDGVLHEESKEVFLERNYRSTDGEWHLDSIYEFRHFFDLPEILNGRIMTVYVDAYDKKAMRSKVPRKPFTCGSDRPKTDLPPNPLMYNDPALIHERMDEITQLDKIEKRQMLIDEEIPKL